MSLDIDYGISEQLFDGEEKPMTTVMFGDGLTSIQSSNWDDGNKGIVMRRNASGQPFVKEEYQEGTTTSNFEGEKVFIIFDNEKSIDVMINKLKYVRDNL